MHKDAVRVTKPVLRGQHGLARITTNSVMMKQ